MLLFVWDADSCGFPGAGVSLRFAQQAASGRVSGRVAERSYFCMMLQDS